MEIIPYFSYIIEIDSGLLYDAMQVAVQPYVLLAIDICIIFRS